MPVPSGRHALRRAARHRASRRRPSALAVLAFAVLSAATVTGGVVAATGLNDAPTPSHGSVDVRDRSPNQAETPRTRAREVPIAVAPTKPRQTPEAAKPPSRSPQPVVVPEHATGRFEVAPAPADEPTGTTYEVAVEVGLPVALRSFAEAVNRTLQAASGWTGTGRHAVGQTNHDADLRIVLASPATADLLCAPLDTGGRLSCRNGRDVVINAWRWVNGAESYADDLEGYRTYVVNHEVGHALGYGHVPCPTAGALAPVMVQQTKGLEGCRANPWPALVDLRP